MATNSTTSVCIRRATPADASTVHTMVRELADHEQEQRPEVDANGWRELLRRPEVIVLLAEHDDRALGYVSAVRRLHLPSGREHLDLDPASVRAGSRHAGIGCRLLLAMARYAAPDTPTADAAASAAR